MSQSDPKPTEIAEKKEAPNEFQIMDKRDETQIIQEMQGETALIEEYVYSFKQGSRQVTSLSYAGVKEMVRRRGNFEIISTEKEETDKTIRVIVKIRDLVNRVDFLGASETEKDKAFAYVLAVNKAERNAYRKAMPTELLSKMVDAFLHGTPKQATPTSTPTVQEKVQNLPQSQTPQPQAFKPDSPMEVEAQFPEELREKLNFHFADDKVIINPREFLGSETFAKVSAIVKGIGGKYVSAGKDSHFEVPLKEPQA